MYFQDEEFYYARNNDLSHFHNNIYDQRIMQPIPFDPRSQEDAGGTIRVSSGNKNGSAPQGLENSFIKSPKHTRN